MAVKSQRWVAQKKCGPHRQEPMAAGWARVVTDDGWDGHGGARGKWWRARIAMMIIGAPQCGQRQCSELKQLPAKSTGISDPLAIV